METKSFHAPFDRYSVAFPEVGITYLADVEWTVLRPSRFHSHREMQVLIILDGGMGIETSERKIEPAAGVCYVIPADKVHAVSQNPVSPRVRFFDLRLINEPACTMVRFLESLGQFCLPVDQHELRISASSVRDALSLEGPRKLARLQAVLWEIISKIAAANAQQEHGETERSVLRIRAADAIMRDRLAQPLSIDVVAEAAGLSRSQLTRLYMKHHAMGPAERLRHLRIERARELMTSSTLTVKEVAHLCGFVCPNHFCRVFLQTTGATPTAYRLAQISPR
ncbi:MAG TPA: helix-turn-helix domain-containing protein [Planctomycetota bacterium]|nr:helix-turn-helix domain-containing protein [Planctomycetota bacterium]